MPLLFDFLYREYCRARLAEMRKELLLWPGCQEVLEANGYADHADGASDRAQGLGDTRYEANHGRPN